MGEGAWLVAFLIAQRLIELCLAQLNTRRLRGVGGIEFGAAKEKRSLSGRSCSVLP